MQTQCNTHKRQHKFTHVGHFKGYSTNSKDLHPSSHTFMGPQLFPTKSSLNFFSSFTFSWKLLVTFRFLLPVLWKNITVFNFIWNILTMIAGWKESVHPLKLMQLQLHLTFANFDSQTLFTHLLWLYMLFDSFFHFHLFLLHSFISPVF